MRAFSARRRRRRSPETGARTERADTAARGPLLARRGGGPRAAMAADGARLRGGADRARGLCRLGRRQPRRPRHSRSPGAETPATRQGPLEAFRFRAERAEDRGKKSSSGSPATRFRWKRDPFGAGIARSPPISSATGAAFSPARFLRTAQPTVDAKGMRRVQIYLASFRKFLLVFSKFSQTFLWRF